MSRRGPAPDIYSVSLGAVQRHPVLYIEALSDHPLEFTRLRVEARALEEEQARPRPSLPSTNHTLMLFV